MVRILILIILVWALYHIIKRIVVSTKPKPSEKPEETPEETIVQCAHCGCHVPMSESQIKNNKIICNNPECQTQTNQKDQHGD
jgi:formylmethanofuran dehydrogenase subunit E